MSNSNVKKIIDHIQAAFCNVRLEGGVSLHEAEVIDAYGTDAERSAARKKDNVDAPWQDVPPNDIENHGSILSFVDSKGFRYYLPAFMTWTLRNFRRSNCMSIDSTIYALDLSTDTGIRKWQLERFSLLNQAQAKAIYEFLTHMAYDAEDHCDGRVARDALRHHWKKFC